MDTSYLLPQHHRYDHHPLPERAIWAQLEGLVDPTG